MAIFSKLLIWERHYWKSAKYHKYTHKLIYAGKYAEMNAQDVVDQSNIKVGEAKS